MKFLFFDTETTGKPLRYGASYTELDNWPRVTQLAWLLADLEGTVLDQRNDLIKPDGWEIPKEQFFIDNGMSTERSMELGVPIDGVIENFMGVKYEADVLVAHNLAFDHPVLWAEIIRSGREPRSGMLKVCTMIKSTSYCNIPKAKGKGAKWPKLEELYQVLFGKAFDGAHDALADITATKDCFFELVRLGVIDPKAIESKGVRA